MVEEQLITAVAAVAAMAADDDGNLSCRERARNVEETACAASGRAHQHCKHHL